MVAQGAGAAGPVLLACRQWDPLGLARRLPSPGVGAWRSAPLLPWRVQCSVRVCAALAAGSGGSGRYLVLCLSRFPLPAPRVPRCVLRAVLSGCPLPSLAFTPFNAVCAYCELGLVAILVVPACPLRVCALALPQRPLPPPMGGVACAPRAVPALGAGRAIPRGPYPSACPAPVPCSVWRAWGGGGPVPVPPYLAWGFSGVAEGRPRAGCLPLLRGASEVRRSPSPDCPPTGRAVGVRYPRAVGAGVCLWGPNTVPLACTLCGGCVPRGWWEAVPLPGLGLCAPRGAGPWRSCSRGRAGGGGGPCPVPPVCATGGPVGRGVPLRPSAFPGQATKRVSLASFWSWGAWLPYHSGSCSAAVTGLDLCGVLAPWYGLPCSSWFLWEPAAGAGGRTALRLLSRAGEGGTIPPASEGGGPGPRSLRAGGGGWGGGSRRGLPAPPLGGGPRFPTLAPLLSSAHSPPVCAFSRGRGPPRGGGGDEERPLPWGLLLT